MTDSSWQPTASLDALKHRATLLNQIRDFFQQRGVLEVETPLLSHGTVTDPYVIGIPAVFQPNGAAQSHVMYLQTSPEYAMKRLLAADSGPIFQLCKAFRQGDLGRIHNPEFTMLEWYRPGFDHHALMDEMDALLQWILKTSPAERLSYGDMFEKFVNVNPHTATDEELQLAVNQYIDIATQHDRTTMLDLLFTHGIEPHLGSDRPVFVYDFPPIKAALAKIRFDENPPLASRFEVYFRGVELANGFHELQDPDEQRRRFEDDITYRKNQSISPVPVDERFLAALMSGLPDCAGVALGVDRLIMLALDAKSLASVVSFPFEKA